MLQADADCTQCTSKLWANEHSNHPFSPCFFSPPTPALHLQSAHGGRWSLHGNSDICRPKQWLPCAGPQSTPEACCYCVWVIHMQISGYGPGWGQAADSTHTTPKCKRVQVPKLMWVLKIWQSEWLGCWGKKTRQTHMTVFILTVYSIVFNWIKLQLH